MGRKACRREVKDTLRRVGLPIRRAPIMSQADVTRAFLAAKCLNCLRCPKVCAKLADWRRAHEVFTLPSP